MKLRVVFDTNILVSTLVLRSGRLSWLQQHWREAECIPLLSSSTLAELYKVLNYPKFHLSEADQEALFRKYLRICEMIPNVSRCELQCRDEKDQRFLDLAVSGSANVLVSGDEDLLSLAPLAPFRIESPAIYRQRFISP